MCPQGHKAGSHTHLCLPLSRYVCLCPPPALSFAHTVSRTRCHTDTHSVWLIQTYIGLCSILFSSRLLHSALENIYVCLCE